MNIPQMQAEQLAPVAIAIKDYYNRTPEDLFSSDLMMRPNLNKAARLVTSKAFTLHELTEETVENLSVLRQDPGFIAPRHLDEFDIPVTGLGLHRAGIEPAYYIAKAELMARRSSAWLLGHIGGIPVDREHANIPHLARLTKHVLDNEKRSVVAFPEGTRTNGDTVWDLDDGVPVLACRNKRVIVPVGIYGTGGALRRLRHGKRPHTAFVAAEPIDTRGMKPRVVKEELKQRMQIAYDEARETVLAA